MNKIVKDRNNTRPMSLQEIRKEASFPMFTMDRITGVHCRCNGNGKFVLLDRNDPLVLDGGKDYIECINCGGISHL